MIYKLESKWGENISSYADRLISYWQELSEKDLAIVEGQFNGHNFVVGSDSTAKKLVDEFHQKNKKEAKEYRKSKEYIQLQRKNRRDIEKRKKSEHVLLKHMKKLDYTDSGKVLEWVMDYYNTTNHINVKSNLKKVYAELRENGYIEKANTNEKFNAEDRDNVAIYIIGKFMDSARWNHACPQIIESFYSDYVLKFVYKIPEVKAD